jgi:alginate O-acetyltransferase complex protein AlgI
MAIGLARMFNVRFPLNFDSPYKSASVIEFWQRWHMTLTRFLTRYIYSPLAVWVMRRRRKQGRPITGAAYTTLHGFSTMIAFPVATTMALAGIWHGSGAQFLVFGLLHAFYLCVNHAWRIFGPKPRGGPPRFMAHAGNVLLTYLCVLVASIFFRAPSVGGALSLIGGMVGLHGWGLALIVPHALLAGHSSGSGALLQSNGLIRAGSWNEAASATLEIAWLAALFLIVWMMPNTEQVFADYAPALQPLRPPSSRWLRWRVSLPWAIALGCTATLAILSVGGTSEFLYFQF